MKNLMTTLITIGLSTAVFGQTSIKDLTVNCEMKATVLQVKDPVYIMAEPLPAHPRVLPKPASYSYEAKIAFKKPNQNCSTLWTKYAFDTHLTHWVTMSIQTTYQAPKKIPFSDIHKKKFPRTLSGQIFVNNISEKSIGSTFDVKTYQRFDFKTGEHLTLFPDHHKETLLIQGALELDYEGKKHKSAMQLEIKVDEKKTYGSLDYNLLKDWEKVQEAKKILSVIFYKINNGAYYVGHTEINTVLKKLKPTKHQSKKYYFDALVSFFDDINNIQYNSHSFFHFNSGGSMGSKFAETIIDLDNENPHLITSSEKSELISKYPAFALGYYSKKLSLEKRNIIDMLNNSIGNIETLKHHQKYRLKTVLSVILGNYHAPHKDLFDLEVKELAKELKELL